MTGLNSEHNGRNSDENILIGYPRILSRSLPPTAGLLDAVNAAISPRNQTTEMHSPERPLFTSTPCRLYRYGYNS